MDQNNFYLVGTHVTNPIETLTGIRLRIYCYLLKQNEPIGSRAIQRALRLKSASHATYHLDKLLELNIVEKNLNNSYILKPDYNTRSIKLNVLSEYFLFGGRVWPKSIFISSYFIVSIIFAIIINSKVNFILQTYLVVTLVLSSVYIILAIRSQIKALPWEERED